MGKVIAQWQYLSSTDPLALIPSIAKLCKIKINKIILHDLENVVKWDIPETSLSLMQQLYWKK